MKKEFENISIKGDVFETICVVFDASFQNLLKAMSKNGSDEGSIVVKIDVSIEPVEVTGEDGKLCFMNKPVLKHKVTTQVPVKETVDGRVDSDRILVFDDKSKKFVLKRADIDGQMSIFDLEDEYDESVVDEPERIALPAPADEYEYDEETGEVKIEDSQDESEDDGSGFVIPDDEHLDEYDYEQFESELGDE